MRRDDREFAVDSSDFKTLFYLTKELECGRKTFDDPMKDINGRLLNHNEEVSHAVKFFLLWAK